MISKLKVGLTDIIKLNDIYNGYKSGAKFCCSHCLKNMKRTSNLNAYCDTHSMVNGVDVKMSITQFWLGIKNAYNSIDGNKFGNTEELELPPTDDRLEYKA